MGKSIIVAMDGPAGVGKSTAARRVAAALGFTMVDTGALYRCLALLAHQQHVPWTDGQQLGHLAQRMRVVFEPLAGGQRVLMDDVDVTEAIRTREMSMGASAVSGHGPVRAAFLDMQRALARGASRGAVLEGRDIGTVVCPDASIKFFLTATPEVRAQRRYDELFAKGVTASFDDILHDVKMRDEQDMSRALAPLRAADDAEIVDTSTENLDDVVLYLLERVRKVCDP